MEAFNSTKDLLADSEKIKKSVSNLIQIPGFQSLVAFSGNKPEKDNLVYLHGDFPDLKAYKAADLKKGKSFHKASLLSSGKCFEVGNEQFVVIISFQEGSLSEVVQTALTENVAQVFSAELDSYQSGLFRDLVEKSGDLIFEINGDGIFTYVNPELEKVTGYSSSELRTMHFLQLLDQESFAETLDTIMQKVKEKAETIQYVCPIKSRDFDRKFYMELRLNLFYDGKWLTKVHGVARNITKRKQGEERLKETERKLKNYKEGLKALNEISSDVELNVDQQIESALRVCTDFLQMNTGILSVIEGQHYTISNIYSEEQKLEKGQVLEFENTFSSVFYNKSDTFALEHVSNTTFNIHPATKLFNLEAYIGATYFVAGQKRGTVVFTSPVPKSEPFDANDLEFVRLLSRWIGFILQHQEYEKKLMLDKMVLQAFVAAAPAAIAMLDREFKFIAASDKWYQDYDLENEFIIGKSYFEVIPESGQDWKGIFEKALAGRTEHNNEDLVEREAGDIKWIKWEVRPWFEKLEVVGGLVIYTEDITESKDQQLQLKIAKRKAEQASSAKEQFLSTMSHEIRTPLNAIIGMTDVMLMDEQTEEQRKHLDLLKFSGDNLLVLINDILDFNKIEAGKLELQIKPFDIISQLEKIKNSLSNLVKEKDLIFDLDVSSEIPRYVKGDAIRLGQVLTNLVNNAIKFTESGSVILKVESVSDDGAFSEMRFSVTDTGIGIQSDRLELIFRSFEQADLEVSRKYGGSGLGLAISKKILKLMNSTIAVESTPGEGSCFSFNLNLEKAVDHVGRTDPATMALQLRKDLKVLVAEDNAGNQILIQSLFKRWDIDFEFAENGLEAVEKIKKKSFHLILMDLQMPEMDGYEATTTIREMEEQYFKEVPIIALTASVMSHVLEKTIEVGMNAYISKPFNPKELMELIATHTGFFAEDVKAEDREIVSMNTMDTDAFPYLKSLIGDDPDSLSEIVSTTIQSIMEATKGMMKGLEANDLAKVRQELHVLRPNLHNLELGEVINDLPAIRELTPENTKSIMQLEERIKNALSSPRLAIFI